MKKEENFRSENNEDSQNQNNHSCPTVIEQDITMSRNQKQQFLRIARSQQIEVRSRLEYDEINQYQLEDHKNQNNKIAGTFYAQNKIQPAIKYQRGTNFDCEIVQSMQFSCDQQSFHSNSRKKGSQSSLQQQKESPRKRYKKNKQSDFCHQRQNEQEKKQQISNIKDKFLNVLVAGGQDTGKTTFIRCFQQRQREKDSCYIRERSKKIKYGGRIQNQNHHKERNSIYFIDVPGFRQKQQKDYVREIRQYAINQWRNYGINKKDDKRIACCLYFFRGPRIKHSDFQVIKQLSQMFSLIPILAKSDHYTIEQVKEIKRKFLQVIEQQKINIYDIKQYLRYKFSKQEIDFIYLSNLGPIPPFAIASSEIKQQGINGKFIRKYPWGILQVENQDHTQFQILSIILTRFIKQDLLHRLQNNKLQKSVQKVESQIQSQFVNQMDNQQINNEVRLQKKMNWGKGIAIFTLVVGLIGVGIKYRHT